MGANRLDGWGPYFEDLALPNWSSTDERQRYRVLISRMPKDSRYKYDAYLILQRKKAEPSVEYGSPDLLPYDLAERPEDVCLIVAGGNMLGGRFVSNTIIVPKDAIARALNGVH